MELLRADNLRLSIGSRDLLENLSFALQRGQRLGLVGRNGSGKTTLLRILMGEAHPDSGRVVRSPGLRFVLLHQGTQDVGRGTVADAAAGALAPLRELEAAMREAEEHLAEGEERLTAYAVLTERFEAAGGYGAEARQEAILAGFGYAPESYGRNVNSLSGGERSRLALALALSSNPDVLLLDEPSNHLDIRMRRILADILVRYEGGLLLASHDRALLDAVATHTLYLEGGTLTRYRGNYSSFREQLGTAVLTRQKAQKEQEKLTGRLERTAQKLTGWGNRTAVQQRKAIAKRLERLEPLPNAPAVQREADIEIIARRPKGTLLKVEKLRKAYDERVLVDNVTLTVDASDKIALVGANGSGKSTLLKLLTGELESDNPQTLFTWGERTKVAVFDQHARGLQDGVPLMTQLSSYVNEVRAQMLLALVGLTQAGERLPESLSGGERARAGIALMMATEANLLLLDEPSEHLDIAMTEKLEAALADTGAAFLLVSHDAALVEGVANRVWTLDNGKIREFRGGIKGYFSNNPRLSIDPEELEPEAPPPPKEASEAELTERLELERIRIDDTLLHEPELTDRDRERLRRRYREIMDELSEHYDRRYPPPLPRYRAQEGTVRVEGNAEGQGFSFSSNSGLAARLMISGGLGHLVLSEPQDRTVLEWAYSSTVRGLSRITFERLSVGALQLQSGYDLSDVGFQAGGEDYWVLSRAEYETQEGYASDEAPVRRRVQRLAFHPDWEMWANYHRYLMRRTRRS